MGGNVVAQRLSPDGADSQCDVGSTCGDVVIDVQFISNRQLDVAIVRLQANQASGSSNERIDSANLKII